MIEISEALAIRAARWLMTMAETIAEPEGEIDWVKEELTQEYKDAKQLYALVRAQKQARKAHTPKRATVFRKDRNGVL